MRFYYYILSALLFLTHSSKLSIFKIPRYTLLLCISPEFSYIIVTLSISVPLCRDDTGKRMKKKRKFIILRERKKL